MMKESENKFTVLEVSRKLHMSSSNVYRYIRDNGLGEKVDGQHLLSDKDIDFIKRRKGQRGMIKESL